MEKWYPKARIKRYRLSGGKMIGGPGRIVLHTTETKGVPRYGSVLGRNTAPHFTVDHDGTVLQHQPITLAARALRNKRGGVQTNRQGRFCVQIELVGFAAKVHELPAAQIQSLVDLVDWVCEQTGIPKRWREVARGRRCYGERSPCRMSWNEWEQFEGICGHSEVPENAHWDPGNFDFGVFAGSGEREDDTMLPLRLGDGWKARLGKKEDVRLLQLYLTKLGQQIVVDGAYGPKTAAAVKATVGGDGEEVDAADWMQLMEKLFGLGQDVLRRGDTVRLR